ncbi:MAG: RNB domain-containing ribonuclease [Prochlorococcus sp. ALOHA_A2.0_51]|nr:RNB domain-containing ribonuclease [Prochlorococcus sp. ALOHA_A2.0_51]
MKFTVADLLDQLPPTGGLEIKKLEKILKLTTKADRDGLETALQALLKLGIVNNEEAGAIKRSDDESLIEARLRCSSKGFCFALRDDGGDDIYIRDHQLNHAWNGDRVLVRITRDGGRRRSPEGGVQCILERTTTSLLGHVERKDQNILAIPLDDRILATIQLPDGDQAHLNDGEQTSVVEVKLDRYPIAQFPAEGHVARSLPLNGGPSSDRDLLLTKANLQDRPAPPRSSLKTPTAKHRQDLSSQPALLLRSWQVSDAPPLPAVYVEPHAGGTRLWIHAPAVAERLSIGNNLDLWLRDRAEALCLGEVWHPLLGQILSKACSFKVGEINDAVSVALDISADGEVTNWHFSLSSIKPVAEIGPKTLTALSNRKPKARTVPAALKPVKDHLAQLETLIFCARTLQMGEQASGSIELDLAVPELQCLGDLRWADPDSYRHQWALPLDQTDPQSVLSPMIRAAHRAWAQHAQNLQLPGLVIEASEADNNTLNDVAKSALALDIALELDEEGSPAATELAKAFSTTACRRVLDQQLRHALPEPLLRLGIHDSQKENGNIESDHEDTKSMDSNLQSPWCCPTIHYTDLVNQEIIVSLLSNGKDRPNVRQKEKVVLGSRECWQQIKWPLFSTSQAKNLEEICSKSLVHRLNTLRRQAEELRQDLIAMVQARIVEPLVGEEHQGVISGVQSYGFFVEIPPSMAEGLVHVSSLNDDWYEYRSRQNRLVGRKNRKIYQLGDQVNVKVVKVDALRNQIDLEVNGSAITVEANMNVNSDLTNQETTTTKSEVKGKITKNNEQLVSSSEA